MAGLCGGGNEPAGSLKAILQQYPQYKTENRIFVVLVDYWIRQKYRRQIGLDKYPSGRDKLWTKLIRTDSLEKDETIEYS
ncbi:hypothetical protein ANN_24626 [Periplaneta americana]|uniref:Uncharacterized protein n=1 Tax=Periplaneta americana TaxID=6978 RepID=A0ABQ8S3W2_PERAM|nr:hypothetical protein ANN_24626 [Periplaneta americana]